MEPSDNNIQIKMICNTTYMWMHERYKYDTYDMPDIM